MGIRITFSEKEKQIIKKYKEIMKGKRKDEDLPSKWVKGVHPKTVLKGIKRYTVPGSKREKIYFVGICELDGKFYSILHDPGYASETFTLVEIKYNKFTDDVIDVIGPIEDDEEFAVIVNWFLDNHILEITDAVPADPRKPSIIPGTSAVFMWPKKGGKPIVSDPYLKFIEKLKK